jgi:amino acid adenylation domain-containing protein
MSCIDELFAAQVQRAPDATAIIFSGQSLTYRELDQRAERLAEHLRGLGVGPDVLVALFLDRSFDMVVGMLGVLKAGGAYIPLDPIHPPQRLAYMLADAQPLVLVTQQRLLAALPPHAAHVVAIDASLPDARALEVAPQIFPRRSSRDLAYVIYTSGSTGNPKGVEIEHRSVVNFLNSMQRRPGCCSADIMLAITTPVFDIAVLEIFLPLICGARIVIASSETTKDGMALIDLIERTGVTVVQATPSTLRMLLDIGWTGSPELKILCGGEAWSEELARALLACCGSLWNMYGPTETTVWSAVSRVRPGQSVAIGQPIARTELYVLDAMRQLVPAGVAGELFIGGDGLARGYFNRPALTQERFVADPFAAAPGARMYRTGDEVLRLQDGTLKFIGRIDQQIKIRGFRIEPSEIEAALRTHAGITKAVVIAREDQPGEMRLVAYVISSADISSAACRAHLAAVLPEYMIPAAYIRLDVLPLTPNGKLNRKALPPPQSLVNEADVEWRAARTPVEQVLTQIWCEMLGLSQIGMRDNFFDLGGHSLLAVRCVGNINKALNGRISIPAFCKDPTIEGLAKALEPTRDTEPGAQLLPLQTGRTGLPLYFIGAGPHEIRLAQNIGADRAIFAIEAPIPVAWHGKAAPADRPAMPTISDLGALYGDVLHANAGSAPCVIAGYSFAGKIAFEAARVLQNAGGDVACVLLIDAPAHIGEGHIGITLQRSLHWIRQNAATAQANGVHKLTAIASMLKNYARLFWWLCAQTPIVMRNRIDHLRQRSTNATNTSGYFDKDGVPIEQAVMDKLHFGAGRAWTPRQLDAPGVLFRVASPCEKGLPGYDLSKGWENLFARGLKIVHSAGDHMTMVRDENIVALTQQIRTVLDQGDSMRQFTIVHFADEAVVGCTTMRPRHTYQLDGLS